MYVGMAWVHPCLIALEGEYIKLPIYMVICMLLYKGRFYVCRCGLGTSLAGCFGRRVYMVTYYED